MYEYNATVERVVDGDTLEVLIDLGLDVGIRTILRLNRINAYETKLGVNTTAEKKAKGIAGRDHLKAMFDANSHIVVLTIKDKTEKYGRYLAEVTHNGVSINDQMVSLGYAIYQGY